MYSQNIMSDFNLHIVRIAHVNAISNFPFILSKCRLQVKLDLVSLPDILLLPTVTYVQLNISCLISPPYFSIGANGHIKRNLRVHLDVSFSSIHLVIRFRVCCMRPPLKCCNFAELGWISGLHGPVVCAPSGSEDLIACSLKGSTKAETKRVQMNT